MECLAAKNRLLRSGMPATLEHGDASATSEKSNNAAVVAQSVQYFITAMDSLKINMTAVDQLHPLLNDLLMSLCKVQQLPPDFTVRPTRPPPRARAGGRREPWRGRVGPVRERRGAHSRARGRV